MGRRPRAWRRSAPSRPSAPPARVPGPAGGPRRAEGLPRRDSGTSASKRSGARRSEGRGPDMSATSGGTSVAREIAIAASPPSPSMIRTVASSIRERQSHSTLPCGVDTRNARWPMAKPGSVPMSRRPGSTSWKALRCVRASAARLVQAWPPAGTNWRSSAQIGQISGAGASGNSVPQATHIGPVIVLFSIRAGGSIRWRRRRAAQTNGRGSGPGFSPRERPRSRWRSVAVHLAGCAPRPSSPIRPADRPTGPILAARRT